MEELILELKISEIQASIDAIKNEMDEERSFSKREMYFDGLAGLGSVLTRLNNQEDIPDYSYVINSTIIRLWISKEGLMEAVRLSENINWIKEIELTQQSTFFANPEAKEKIINYKNLSPNCNCAFWALFFYYCFVFC